MKILKRIKETIYGFGDRHKRPNMSTALELTEFIRVQENFNRYEDDIIEFFESFQEDGINYGILNLMFGELTGECSWKNDLKLGYKKKTWIDTNKRLRISLIKLGKDELIEKAELFRETKKSFLEDGESYNEIIQKILKSKKEGLIHFNPSFDHFIEVEDWIEDCDFIGQLKRVTTKDELIEIMENGIDTIEISESDISEYCSVLTLKNNIILTISETKTKIKFLVSSTKIKI